MLVAALDKPQPQSIGLQARGREVSLGSSVGLGEVEGVFGRDGAGVPLRPPPIAHRARGHCRLPLPVYRRIIPNPSRSILVSDDCKVAGKHARSLERARTPCAAAPTSPLQLLWRPECRRARRCAGRVRRRLGANRVHSSASQRTCTANRYNTFTTKRDPAAHQQFWGLEGHTAGTTTHSTSKLG